jgi:hypothetical protein
MRETKSDKTKESYRVYISRWISPRWGREHIHKIKPVPVEDWIRSLPLADGSKAKMRSIMSAVFTPHFELLFKGNHLHSSPIGSTITRTGFQNGGA